MATIKTTIALEFGNRRHRDEFLKAFQRMLFTFGNKAPKTTITLTQKTEAEFGDPSALDLWFIGVESEAAGPLATLMPDSPLAQALAAAEALVGAAPPPHPSDADSAPQEPAEEAGATFEPPPVLLPERVLHALAVYGPLTPAALAAHLGEDEETLVCELERLHAAGDVEPDDGGLWRLNADEGE